MVALLLICLIMYIFILNRNFMPRMIKIILVGIAALIVMRFAVPSFYERIVGGISDFWQSSEGNDNTTFSVRTGTLASRYMYLRGRHKLLFGIGPVHGDYVIANLASSNIYDVANVGVIASDIAYGSILIRYGLVGIFLIIYSCLYIFIRGIRTREIHYICLGLSALGMIIGAVVSHSELCFSGLLRFGMLIGITMKANNDLRKKMAIDNSK